jgi:hypothetical protein
MGTPTDPPRLPARVPEFREHTEADPMESNASYQLRMLLIRRYSYLTLKFTNPFVSDSGHWEARWNGGHAEGITQDAMLQKVLAELEDCGSDGHLWETVGEQRDPINSDNVLLRQRLACVFCDPKERVITIYHPGRTVLESSRVIP